jgi:hypothetical protein
LECCIVLSLFWKSHCSPCNPVTHCFDILVTLCEGYTLRSSPFQRLRLHAKRPVYTRNFCRYF